MGKSFGLLVSYLTRQTSPSPNVFLHCKRSVLLQPGSTRQIVVRYFKALLCVRAGLIFSALCCIKGKATRKKKSPEYPIGVIAGSGNVFPPNLKEREKNTSLSVTMRREQIHRAQVLCQRRISSSLNKWSVIAFDTAEAFLKPGTEHKITLGWGLCKGS